MSKSYSFSAVGLRPGQKLVSAFNDNETATVVDDTHIQFRGALTSLTPAALKLAAEAGKKWSAISRPLYWKLPNGQNLVDYRQEFARKLDEKARAALDDRLTWKEGDLHLEEVGVGPSQGQSTKLIDALRSVAQKPGALEKTKGFIKNETQLRLFAENIQEGSERAAFLTIPGIDPEIYEDLRTILNGEMIGDQTIVVKRGRAGGITLITTPVDTTGGPPPTNPTEEKEVQEQAEKLDSKSLRLEKEYYPLVKAWAQQEGYAKCEITGGKLPGYRWENPDLIAIDYVVNEYARSVAFDITSFEVKLLVEPSAAWQAAHYKHFSREVYIAFAQDEKTIREQDSGRVFDLAIELGLGVLAFEDGKFKVIQSPKANVPQESAVSEILSNYKRLEVVQEAIDEVSEKLDSFYERWMFPKFGAKFPG